MVGLIKKSRVIIIILFLTLVLIGYNAKAAEKQTKQWTFMVYLDGDNNLEEYCIDGFLEMAMVGSTNNIDIVVQFDRIPEYDSRYDDWTTTRRYHILPGSVPSNTDPGLIADLGELNMGDPATLVGFVEWAMDNYPAERYAWYSIITVMAGKRR